MTKSPINKRVHVHVRMALGLREYSLRNKLCKLQMDTSSVMFYMYMQLRNGFCFLLTILIAYGNYTLHGK